MSESKDRHEEIILERALAFASAEARDGYLAGACGDDEALRQKIEALIRAHEKAAELQLLGMARRDKDADTKLAPTVIAFPETTGTTIGRYKLLQKIGEGGCGIVYMAEQEEPVRRRVALKIIKLGMDTRSVIARFEAERQALALMDHANIAKVLDAGATETGRPYFVMELVRGIKITDYCDQNNLATRERLDLFLHICHAIQHAHQKGIIHRDIKPSNILVTLHDGIPIPKVIDFGIAKATTDQRLTDKTLFTAFEQFIGTPAYMSPEQAEMSTLDIDTRSDIYSLGVLLYELLTGKTPFEARTLLQAGLDEMRRIIREDEPARPSTRLSTMLGPDLSAVAKHHAAEPPKLINLIRGDLDWIVMKCLEKDRTRRYETANALALDLKRHRSHEPVRARPPSVIYQFQKWVHRHKLGFAAASAVTVALILGFGFSTWSFLGERRARADEGVQRQAAEQQRRLAETNAWKAAANEQRIRRILYAADITLAQQAVEVSNFGRARALLERTRPAAGEKDLRGWEWRYLWQQCQVDPHQRLEAYSNVVSAVAISPDSHWFATVAEEKLDLWELRSRERLVGLSSEALAHRRSVAWSPDGSSLAACLQHGRVVVFKAGTWEQLSHHELAENVRSPAFTPDGRRLAFLSGRLHSAIQIMDVNSGLILETIQTPAAAAGFGGSHVDPLCFSPDGETLATGGGSGTIHIWRRSTGWRQLGGGLEDTVTALAFLADGSKLLSGTGYSDFSIRVWDLTSGSLERILTGHNGWVSCLVVSGDGRTLFSASADQTVRLWDVQSWTVLGRRLGHSGEVHALAVSPDDRVLISAGRGGELFVWDATSEKSGPAPSLQGAPLFVPDGGKLARLKRLVQKFPSPDSSVAADLALIESTESHFVRVWRRGDVEILPLDKGAPAVWLKLGVALSGAPCSASVPGKSWVIVGDETGLVWVIDADGGRIVHHLRGHLMGVHSVAVSPDGQRLATGSGGREAVKLWDLEMGQELLTLAGPGFVYRGTRFTSDGNEIRAITMSGHPQSWKAPTWVEIEEAEGLGATGARTKKR